MRMELSNYVELSTLALDLNYMKGYEALRESAAWIDLSVRGGSKFIRGLATPFPPEAVFSSIEAGMPADVILFASVASINGLRNQEATLQGITPADPDFHRMRALARQIQLSGAVRIVVKKDAGEEMVSFMTFRAEQVPPDVLSEIVELRRLLKLDPNATEYKVRFGAVPENNREIAVITRSILSLMQTMAAEVGVPPEDLARGWAFPGFERGKGVPGVVRMISIHSGKSVPPDAFVSVSYTHLRAHETVLDLVCRLLLEKK